MRVLQHQSNCDAPLLNCICSSPWPMVIEVEAAAGDDWQALALAAIHRAECALAGHAESVDDLRARATALSRTEEPR